MTAIERDLPVEQLNLVAMSEGNSKKPVYQIHKWWARRLGSVFRAIILSVFGRSDQTSSEIWRKFCDGADLQSKIVLDPFMGGGTTVVEALRLGCKVVGVDVNPVAWFVTKKEVETTDLGALDVAFGELEMTAGKRISSYYWTTCPAGHHADVMYYFWVKCARCAKCDAKVRLFPNYELSRRDDTNVSVCPRCLQVIETEGYDPDTNCSECGTEFDPRRGVSGRGTFRCPLCQEEQKLLDAIGRKGSALDMELHALEGHCVNCGRFFKRVDDGDLMLWQRARSEFDGFRDNLLLPNQAIPTEGRSDPRPVNHGYTYFSSLFNERQLLCLSILLQEILAVRELGVRELMLAAFSDCLDANNIFCKYEIEWHKLSLIFGLHAYHPIERPAENNVWGTALGRGTFAKCFEKARRAKAYCEKPYERLLDAKGNRYTKRTGSERIRGRLVASFDELRNVDSSALLRCQSSEDLSFLPDRSVDAVVTDPPYFDNVQYSELGDFFYVWLRLALRTTYPCFEPELSSHSREIVKNDKLGKDVMFFNEGLQRVFTECRRVLRDDGLLVFTFHHNKIWAWEGIARLLLDAGFFVSATPIVRSEGKSGFHSSEGNIRYDCVFVCRKKPSPAQAGDWSSMKTSILDDSVAWARRTVQSGMSVNEVDVFTIVMAKTVEYCTKALANGAFRTKPERLTDAIREMADLSDAVAARAAVQPQEVQHPHSEAVEQLALFVVESRAKYEVAKPKGQAALERKAI